MIDLKCGKINRRGAKAHSGSDGALVRPRERCRSFQPNHSKSHQITVNKGMARKKIVARGSAGLPCVLETWWFKSHSDPFSRQPIIIYYNLFEPFERLGKPRKEFVPPKRDEGRKATERAGASESIITIFDSSIFSADW